MFFILFCLIFFGHVTCQVSLYNPYFWTAIINPNSRYSGSTYSIIANSTKKTFSQDFQTVLYEKDNYGHSERILINFGDACEVPSIEEVLGYNQNATFSQFLSTQLIAALIQRGGRCDSWLNKVINLQSFAYINASFQLRSVIIYDNTTSFDNNSNGSNSSVQLYPENQDDPNDPMMNPHSPLPPERNITLMKDNDISHQIKNINQVDISVYFVPNVYGVYLINTLNDVYSTSDSSGNHYLQIAPYFQNKIFSNNDLNNGINNNGQSNGWRDDDGGLFGFGSKGNIAYLVAAAAAVILGKY
ncbi:hypothetical protein BJ944DRAFT_27180 [Cunninghamella echinulata]|nr:hypothetical protein BJ944DRAFT_27180 [Cunninghamella echinulata]